MRPPTQRFSTRVENYVKYRPHYPAEILDVLAKGCGLDEGSTIGDIGSGTGILTALLLRAAERVYAVEPNREMREAAEVRLGADPRFVSVNGTAESTTLADHSVDLVTAGQAFHWFEPDRAQSEFRRILRPDRFVALIWNERLPGGSPFQAGYEELVRKFMPEYLLVNHKQVAREDLAAFFRDRDMQVATFPNEQTFDFEGLVGRVLSSSYAPEPGDSGHEPMMEALRFLFDLCQTEGLVRFLYETQVYYGRV